MMDRSQVEFDWFATNKHDMDLFDLHNNTWDIEDIAVGLSRQCRYNGQYPIGKGFYSVAEHSTNLVYYLVDNYTDVTRDELLFALLHDASEAYLSDIITPFKALIPEYKSIEDEVMSAILRYHNCYPSNEFKGYFSLIDRQVVVDETLELRGKALIEGAGLGVELHMLDPIEAYNKFLFTYIFVTQHWK
jgi:uncharacterized protein